MQDGQRHEIRHEMFRAMLQEDLDALAAVDGHDADTAETIVGTVMGDIEVCALKLEAMHDEFHNKGMLRTADEVGRIADHIRAAISLLSEAEDLMSGKLYADLKDMAKDMAEK